MEYYYNKKGALLLGLGLSLFLVTSGSLTAQDDDTDRGDRGLNDDSDRYQLYDRNREKNDFNEYDYPPTKTNNRYQNQYYPYNNYNSYLSYKENDLYDRNREGRTFSNYDYPNSRGSFQSYPDQGYYNSDSYYDSGYDSGSYYNGGNGYYESRV